MLGLAAGDENAYKSMYHQYEEAIFRLVKKYIKSPELAKDAAQEIFIKVWEKRDKLLHVRDFQPFLFNFARNHAIDVLRAAGRSSIVMGEIARQFNDRSGVFEDETLHKEYRLFIKRTIDSLPPRSREVFLLCREQGKSYQEVATALGISRSAVRKHMVLSMQKFRDAAENELGVSFGLVFPLLTILQHTSDFTHL